VTDFGLAKLLESQVTSVAEAETATKGEVLVGTVQCLRSKPRAWTSIQRREPRKGALDSSSKLVAYSGIEAPLSPMK
jgi:hypothetical protein